MRWAALGVVGATAVVAVVLAGRFGADQTVAPSPLIGRQVPDVSVPRLDGGGDLALLDLAVGKAVVVNFFASWCAACRLEHPDLVATATAYRDRDVLFVGVAYQDDPPAANAFLDRVGRGADTLYAYDPGSRAAIAFGVRGIPETFVIMGDGTVAARLVGPTDALTLGTVLEEVLAGKIPGDRVLGETQQGPGG